MEGRKSSELWERAQKVIPGGVNSPVRAMGSVGREYPLFIKQASGPYIEDVDGRRYIDYVGSWGPMILGHAREIILAAVARANERGSSFGAPTEAEVLLAEQLCEMVPSLDMVRLVNSGTEATMSAIRLARAHTGRDLMVKFDGCYHGHSDGLLVAAGSGLATMGLPASPGVPKPIAELTISLPYNDLSAVKETFEKAGERVACLIVEPVAGNMGVVVPAEGFLAGLRELCDQYGAVLIFDEVITGFRVAAGGAQARFGITPDLTTLGKIIGAGLPMGAYGGKREIMQMVAPAGPMYQAGTLSGNPLATAAGLAALDLLSAPGFYTQLEAQADMLYKGLGQLFNRHGLPHYGQQVGPMFTYFFQDGPVTNYAQATKSDTELFAKYWRNMLAHGVYLAPSQYEATLVSAAHTDAIIDQTLEAVDTAMREM